MAKKRKARKAKTKRKRTAKRNNSKKRSPRKSDLQVAKIKNEAAEIPRSLTPQDQPRLFSSPSFASVANIIGDPRLAACLGGSGYVSHAAN